MEFVCKHGVAFDHCVCLATLLGFYTRICTERVCVALASKFDLRSDDPLTSFKLVMLSDGITSRVYILYAVCNVITPP